MEIGRTVDGTKIHSGRLGWLKFPSGPSINVLDPAIIATILKVEAENLDEAIYRASRRIKVSIVPIQNGAEVDPASEEFETMGKHLGQIIWPEDFGLKFIPHKNIIDIKINPNERVQQTIAGAINSLPHNMVGVCMSEIDQKCVENLKAGDRAVFIARFWKNNIMHFGVLKVN